MDNTSYVSLSLSAGMRRSLDIAANNMANAETVGFRQSQGVFEEYLHRAPGQEDVSYVIDQGTYSDTSQGALTQTGNPLDVAIQGDAWFSYQTPEGDIAYGRDGRFQQDAQGNLVTQAGYSVLDEGGAPVALPQTGGDLSISRDGTVRDENGGALANIGMMDVPNAEAYTRRGNGMLVAPEGVDTPAPTPTLTATMHQGFVEESNVEPLREMTRIMEIERAYGRSKKLTENSDELRQKTIRRLGTVR